MNININQVTEAVNIPVKIYTDDWAYDEYVDNCISHGEAY